MFGRGRKEEKRMKVIMQQQEKKMQEIREQAEKKVKEQEQIIEKMAMKMRQYDALTEMDYEDEYIDPLTGKVNPSNEFKRSRDIYAEHIKDTGSPFRIR